MKSSNGSLLTTTSKRSEEKTVSKGFALNQDSIRFNEAGYLDCLEQEWKGIEKIGPHINEIRAHRSDLA